MKTKTTKKAATKKVVTKKASVKKVATTKTVKFTIHDEKGKTVYLAGDFNKWNPSAKKMTFKAGVYSTTVKLAPGEHQYKFVINGTWCADPANANSVANDQGTFNSVIVVK